MCWQPQHGEQMEVVKSLSPRILGVHQIFPAPRCCRRHLNIRGKSANLPAITDKDWLDLKFGIDVGVDYYALSFVRSADVIYKLKEYLAKHGARLARGPLIGFEG